MKTLIFAGRNWCLQATLGTLLLAGFAQAAPITTLFNTGVDAGGTVLPNGTLGDPHYTLAVAPDGFTSLRIITEANGFPIGPWLGDNAISRWIGPNSNSQLDGPAGNYEYRTTFDLTGLNPATASISGQWATDDGGYQIIINGFGTFNTSAGFSTFTGFTIGSGFIAGVNSLIFQLNNGGGPTGLRVQMSGTADAASAAVPEPASMLLFGTGLAAVCFLRRRYAA